MLYVFWDPLDDKWDTEGEALLLLFMDSNVSILCPLPQQTPLSNMQEQLPKDTLSNIFLK